jgi:DNA-binding NarL/FixJ family response regulator
MPSVLIIDDDLLVRQGLRSLLDQEYRGILFGEAQVAEEALGEVARRKWDLIILDITYSSIPGKDGFHLLDEIRKRYSPAPVLAMSTRTDRRHARRAQQMGAIGYSGKDTARADLSRAIRDVLAGKRHFNGFDPLQQAGALSPSHALSPREYRVLLGLASGKRATEIAADLKLSIKTVSTYKRRLLDKLRLDSTADLVRHVMYHKLS